MRLQGTHGITLSIGGLKNLGFSVAVFILVFVRMFVAQPPFSLDYMAYISIFDVLDDLSFLEIIDDNFIFPYTITRETVPIEVGFALLVKAISLMGFQVETNLAIIAAASVGLRAYLMRKLGVPLIWILAINVVAISLLEANAVRLGVGASLFLAGLVAVRARHRHVGLVFVSISILFHLQIVIFAVPFLFFFLISRWANQSRYNLIISFTAAVGLSIFSVQFLPFLANEKVQEYVARGSSASAGVTITSLLAALLLATSAFALRKRGAFGKDEDFFAAILVASSPSVMMLIILTDIAVIGDRAWQISFLVLSTFFFTNWANRHRRKFAAFILMALTVVIIINVIFRFPLSNFFSPPAPRLNI